jgi:hypothetical protein
MGTLKLFCNGPLHNLDEDIGEKKNYAAQRAGVVKRLKGYMNEFEKDLKKNSRPIGKPKNPRTQEPWFLVPEPRARTPIPPLSGSGKKVAFLQGIPFNTPQPTPGSIKFREGGASFFLRNPRPVFH